MGQANKKILLENEVYSSKTLNEIIEKNKSLIDASQILELAQDTNNLYEIHNILYVTRNFICENFDGFTKPELLFKIRETFTAIDLIAIYNIDFNKANVLMQGQKTITKKQLDIICSKLCMQGFKAFKKLEKSVHYSPIEHEKVLDIKDLQEIQAGKKQIPRIKYK